MRLLKITTCYPDYLRSFFSRNPGLADQPFDKQKAAFDHDAFGWADYWSQALAPLGYEVMEITWNAEPLQRAWAREQSRFFPGRIDPKAIAIEQANSSILTFCGSTTQRETAHPIARKSHPFVSFSAGREVRSQDDAWHHMDLILSCAPESVDFLRHAGYPAAHLHHGLTRGSMLDSKIDRRDSISPSLVS
jgi:hypothetical protein